MRSIVHLRFAYCGLVVYFFLATAPGHWQYWPTYDLVGRWTPLRGNDHRRRSETPAGPGASKAATTLQLMSKCLVQVEYHA